MCFLYSLIVNEKLGQENYLPRNKQKED